MTIKVTTPTNGGDSVEFGSGITPIAAEVTGSEVSSGEGKLELKTTTGGTSTTQLSIDAAGLATFTGATTTAGTVTASGDLAFNSGYGSAATAYGCRAWVNFNGTGTVAIRDSGNVSSITDNGTGDYTVNFTTAMPDANYSCVLGGQAFATGGHQATDNTALVIYNGATVLAASVRVNTQYGNANSGGDYVALHVSIFR
jgi:hypothetical protein